VVQLYPWALDSLFVASYDSQGYSEGIDNRLHTGWRGSVAIVKEWPIHSSERMLHKDHDRKGSAEKKITGRQIQGAWRQTELTGGKPSVVK
jgi:hypothetical protein